MTQPSVILMGSKPGSVVALKCMLERGWDVRYVTVSRKISHPWYAGPTLEEAADQAGLPVVIQPQLPRGQDVDFIISYMFRYRVKPDVIQMARRAAVNFHAAPLPEFGGWAFYNVAILEQAVEYGCTCHHMDENFDTGPLLKVNRFPIDASHETALSLERTAQQEMVRLFVDFLELAESGDPLPCQRQDPDRVRYLTHDEFKTLKQIPADADEETIQRYARAFWCPPYECAYTRIGPHRVDVVPEIAKRQFAQMTQRDSLSDLMAVAEQNSRRKLEV